MKIANNNQQEEYKAFLKNIREEREENPNIIKLKKKKKHLTSQNCFLL